MFKFIRKEPVKKCANSLVVRATPNKLCSWTMIGNGKKATKNCENCLVVCTTPTKLCSWTMTGFGIKATKNCANCLVVCTMHNIQQTLQLDNVQVSLSGRKL